jgi:uncharacterized protein
VGSGPTRARRVLRGIAGAVVIALVVLAAATCALGDRMVFQPGRTDAQRWSARRQALAAEEVELIAADGVRLACWWVPAHQARATVLFFHGNAGDLSGRSGQLRALSRLGANVLAVGYHGYGRSEGEPSEAALALDADAAWSHVVEARGIDPRHVVIFGESLGGGVAIDLAARRSAAGLVVQSAFTSVPAMARAFVPGFPFAALLRSRFDNLAKIPSIAAPKLFLATPTDEVVPYEQTRALYDAAPDPKRWIEFTGVGHNDLFARGEPTWAAAIDAFLDELPSQPAG